MTFDEATAIEQLDSHTYRANFSPEWVIGSVPHGGYVTACFMKAVRRHFDTTLHQQRQPHTVSLHLDFLRRTDLGPAIFKVKDVKFGRTTTIVHVMLYQNGSEEVVGYITNSNIDKETGLSFETSWELHPRPPPLSNLSCLEADIDTNWGERREWPFSDFRTAATKVRAWFPRNGHHSKTCLDMWFCFRDPQSRFTNESLGFICDTFPQLIESNVIGWDIYGLEFERKYDMGEQRKLIKESGFQQMWYPTLLLNLDVKKALPEEGVRFLFSRVQTKQVKNGRYDLEVVLMDAEGDLVALSHHVVYAVSADRNTAGRKPPMKL